MILRESANKQLVIFDPETIKEREFLGKFPGFLREGLYFFSPNNVKVVQNLYKRLERAQFASKSRVIETIRCTPYVKGLLDSPGTLVELPSSFKFHTNPLPHQEIALRFAYSYRNIGLLLEPGLGKTKVVLDYIHLCKFKKSLIVCPKALLFVWEEEVQKHRPELSLYVVKSTSWENEVDSVMMADVVVINYDKAITLEQNLIDTGFEFIGLDEGLIKNHTTERTQSITKISKAIKSRMVMSGTLINNSPLDTFAPVRFIEPALVGTGITKFKDRYAVVSNKNKNIIFGFKDIPEIRSILASCSIVMKKSEWLPHLPKKVFHEIYVQMGDRQRDYYTQLGNNYLLIDNESGLEVEIDNPLTALIKLTQISNGFLYYDNLEEDFENLGVEGIDGVELEVVKPKKRKKASDRETFFFEDQPKITALKGIIDSPEKLGRRRAIIWFNMDAERILIERALEDWGFKYLVVKGGEKSVGKKVNTFNTDPSYRFIVCQAKSVNYGVTIMGSDDDYSESEAEFHPKVSDEIFYSLGFSLEMFLQQQDRIHRIGQTEECKYWLILTNSNIDVKISSRLKEKLECNAALLIDISKDVGFNDTLLN